MQAPGFYRYKVGNYECTFDQRRRALVPNARHLRNPDWHVAYDVDPDVAQATRHKFYDMAAAEKATVVGFHFTFPSIGHVEKDGAKSRLIPIAWNPVI
jgi:hypothetical protein